MTSSTRSLRSGIYCDQLSLAACLKVLFLHLVILGRSTSRDVWILDGISGSSFDGVLRRVLKLVGLNVVERVFFAGYLFTEENEAVYIAARKQTSKTAFRTAEKIINGSRFLKKINARWGRNTVLLFLAKGIRPQIEKLLVRIMVAEALARVDEIEEAHLVVHCPLCAFGRDIIAKYPRVHIHFYRAMNLGTMMGTASGLIKRFAGKAHASSRATAQPADGQGIPEQRYNRGPSLLVLQEDDISMDRSYRSQPHWLFPEDGKTLFRTLVLEIDAVKRMPADRRELAFHNIFLIKQDEIQGKGLIGKSKKTSSMILQDVLMSFLELVSCSSIPHKFASLKVVQLLVRASKLAQFCEQENVRVFMTCENYMRDADAMQLIADALGITTISYQYSNMGHLWLGMQTTADIFLSFSDHYHKVFHNPSAHPRTMKTIGYLFDSSFHKLRARAESLRDQICGNGAKFILCYFDENVQTGKYGLIHLSDHRDEICKLLQLVIDDASIGLIIKAQFQHNVPNSETIPVKLLEQAKQTGRFFELSHGEHRNTVFPAEAALAADMTIGHAIGATASLEAAVAGVRSLIINPYGFRTNNDHLYQRVNILFDSLDDTLHALERYRAGDEEYRDLGDWSSIIHEFDPFRDNGSSRRLREVLDICFEKQSRSCNQ